MEPITLPNFIKGAGNKAHKKCHVKNGHDSRLTLHQLISDRLFHAVYLGRTLINGRTPVPGACVRLANRML